MRSSLVNLAASLITGATVLTAGAVAVQSQTTAATLAPVSSSRTHDVCRYEDGSGQRVCVWDAGHAGNGVGDSFIAINGGTDRARYVYISHRKAHRLTH